MNGDSTRLAGSGRRRGTWPVNALLALGAWLVTEPTRAAVARAEWNAILVGLVVLLLAARRCRQGWSTPSAGSGSRRQAGAGDRQR
jgi:hypothetical protein